MNQGKKNSGESSDKDSLNFILANSPFHKEASLKDNDDAIRNYGIAQTTDMIRELFTSGYAPGVHFYTLNREVASTTICKNLGLWSDIKKPLPWRLSADPSRASEEVRIY